jgi:hypothetical protein
MSLYFRLPSYVEIAGNIDKSIPTSKEANERVVIRIKTSEGITFLTKETFEFFEIVV